MKERLLNLLQYWGPAGREYDTMAGIAAAIRPYVDEIATDPLGNLLATSRAKGKSGTVLLSAAVDQAGGVVLYIEDDGRLRFNNVGTFPVTGAVGHTALFPGGLEGVVCYGEAEDAKGLEIGKLWIDIGATSKGEAEAKVKPGDIFSLLRPPLVFGDVVTAPHLKARAGAAVLVAVAKALYEGGADAPAVTFAFLGQGAVAQRMSRPVARTVAPDLTVVVDLTAEGKGVKVGKGPVLRLRDDGYVAYPAARQALEGAAAAAGVTLQVEVLAKGGTTQALGYFTAGPAHAVGVLTVPAKNLHSVVEQVNTKDLEAAAAVLTAVVLGYVGA